jgi:mannan endo-1,6-alpha-mannosidase
LLAGDIATFAGVLASQLIELLPAANVGPWLTRCEVYSGLIDYAAQLSDHKYDAIIVEELVQQAGTTSPFFESVDIPSANLTTAGQACWALVVLKANDAINNAVPALPSSPTKLAQSVFQQIARKWDITTCGGGLNSTIVSSSIQSKEAMSQITALQLAATFALRSDNGTYTTWAENIFD